MSTERIWETNSTSSAATEQLGERLGKQLKGREVIELVSDLGGGKTTFVRGLAAGAGSPDRVASPTFTISKLYNTDQLQIHHFDFYRLQEAGIVGHELHDVLADPQAVVVVEWGEVVHHVLPPEHITIEITKQSEDARHFVFHYPESLQYIFTDVDTDH